MGFSALLLLLFWRPWRWKTSRPDAITILRYGLTLGLMNLLFYMALRTIPFGIAVAIEFTGPLTVAMLVATADRFPLGAVRRWGCCCCCRSAVVRRWIRWRAVCDGAAACWACRAQPGMHAGHSGRWAWRHPWWWSHAGAALLDPKILAAGLAGGAGVQRDPDVTGDDGAQAPSEGDLRHPDQHGTGGGLWAMLLLHEHLHGLQWLAIGCTVLASVGSTMTARRLKAPGLIKSFMHKRLNPSVPFWGQRRVSAGTSICIARAR